MRFNVRNILPDISAVQKQGDILDSLEASYQAISQGKAASKDAPKTNKPIEQVFKVDLDVETGPEASRLERWFETSKKTQHGYDRIKVRNVFKIKIHDMDTAFVSDNPKEVFHGTSEANCLSILKSGIRTSPPSTAAIARQNVGEWCLWSH